MVLHSSLPIYKVAYDLLSVATDVTKNMPRDFKASLGGRIRDECVELVVLIGRANAAREKAPHLDAEGGDAQVLLGHADPRTTRGYLRGRKITAVEPLKLKRG